MTERSAGAGASISSEAGSGGTGTLEALLHGAKLSVPRVRADSVSRADLITKARSSGCRVVGLTAPAGYGKSTLLAQWAASEDRRVGWVTLHGLDDDPAALLAAVASAFVQISPGSDDLVAEVRRLGSAALGRAAPRLAACLRSSPAPFLLVIDDLQEIRSPACHDVLGVVLSGIPRSSQLAIASRSEQPHLPRWRASGDAIEFGPADLALDVSGAEQIFAARRLDVSHDLAVAITERTEGWPIGLHLAAVTDGSSSRRAGIAVSGDDRYLADYLYTESLAKLSEDLRRFLRRTAVLDQLSAPLCEAALNESGADARLRELEAQGLFLVALDRRRQWYRYQALFREFLLAELRRVEPDLIADLHLRAADWYAANGSPTLALEHLLATTERESCARLVAQLAMATYQAGQIVTLDRWLASLGAAVIEDYPPLAVLAGWVAALSGQAVRADGWAALLDRRSFEEAPVDGTSSFASARAMLAAGLCRDGPRQMEIDARHGVSAEPPWSPWRGTALLMSAEAQLLLGNIDQAATLFAETSAAGSAVGSIDTTILSEAELALLAMARGDWEQAADHVQLALATVEDNRLADYAVSVLACTAAARLAAHRGDRLESNRQLARAMRGRPLCTFALPFLAVRVRLQLAGVYADRGEQSAARHLLAEIDDIVLHRPDLGALLTEVAALREILTSRAPVPVPLGPPLTPAELRLLPYLQTHLTFREIGNRLFLTRNTISSQVGSIYRKLGVSSRSDAVDLATAIGLLGG